jgi:hypothetical protein
MNTYFFTLLDTQHFHFREEQAEQGLRHVAMRLLHYLCLVLTLAMISGCHVGCLGKRAQECKCPTDIRHTLPGCIGEEAIFHCPCGPACAYFGYKPTCWGEWPASGACWRDEHCGPLVPNGNAEWENSSETFEHSVEPEPLEMIEEPKPTEALPDEPPAKSEDLDNLTQQVSPVMQRQPALPKGKEIPLISRKDHSRKGTRPALPIDANPFSTVSPVQTDTNQDVNMVKWEENIHPSAPLRAAVPADLGTQATASPIPKPQAVSKHGLELVPVVDEPSHAETPTMTFQFRPKSTTPSRNKPQLFDTAE